MCTHRDKEIYEYKNTHSGEQAHYRCKKCGYTWVKRKRDLYESHAANLGLVIERSYNVQ